MCTIVPELGRVAVGPQSPDRYNSTTMSVDALHRCGWPSITRPLQLTPERHARPIGCGWPSITRPLQCGGHAADVGSCCGWPSITRPLQSSRCRIRLRLWLRLALNHQTATMRIVHAARLSRLRLALNHQTATISVPGDPSTPSLRLALNHQTATMLRGASLAQTPLRLALNHQTATIPALERSAWPAGCGWPSITRPLQ